MKKLDSVENALIILGSVVGIANIETLLGIILLVVQICLLIFKGILLIRDKLKKNDVKGAIKEINNLSEDLKNITKEKEEE